MNRLNMNSLKVRLNRGIFGSRGRFVERRVRYHMIRRKVRCVTVARGHDPYTLEQLENLMLDKQTGYVKSKDINSLTEQSVADTGLAHGYVRDDQLFHLAVGYCAGI